MALIDPRVLEAQARRAFEVGRLKHGAVNALYVGPMIALSLLACGKPLLSLSGGALLLTLAVGFGSRGGVFGRAVVPGLIAGSAPLLLPLVMRTGGHCCVSGACWSWCMLGCIGGGLLAGITVGVTSVAEREQRGLFLFSATLIAGLGGVLGCAVAGAAGMTAMALAAVTASLPTALLARARAV